MVYTEHGSYAWLACSVGGVLTESGTVLKRNMNPSSTLREYPLPTSLIGHRLCYIGAILTSISKIPSLLLLLLLFCVWFHQPELFGSQSYGHARV